MERRNRQQNIRNNNEGLTLIEIVVSLVIIMAIFTPLIMSFVQASRINRTASVLSYSDDVASNEMERIKAMGVEKYAAYLKTKGYEVTENNDGSYEFFLSDIKQGVTSYDIEITVADDTDPNSNSKIMGMPDVSDFKSSKTLIVFPRTAADNSEEFNGYDEKALHFFSGLNIAKVDNEYRRDYLLAKEENREPPSATDSRYLKASADSIRAVVDRTVVISVDRNSESDPRIGRIAGRGYVIESYVRYTLDENSDILDDSQLHEVDYTGFCDDVYMDEINALFFLYSENSGFRSEKVMITATDDVKNSFAEKLPIDLYFAIQTRDDMEHTVRVDDTGATDSMEITYYTNSNGNLVTLDSRVIEAKKRLVKDGGESYRIVKIDISVFEHDAFGTERKRVGHLTSTYTKARE